MKINPSAHPTPNYPVDPQNRSFNSLKTVCLGLGLVVLNCYWIMMSLMFGGGESATINLIYNVVFTLFLLIAGNCANELALNTSLR